MWYSCCRCVVSQCNSLCSSEPTSIPDLISHYYTSVVGGLIVQAHFLLVYSVPTDTSPLVSLIPAVLCLLHSLFLRAYVSVRADTLTLGVHHGSSAEDVSRKLVPSVPQRGASFAPQESGESPRDARGYPSMSSGNRQRPAELPAEPSQLWVGFAWAVIVTALMVLVLALWFS